VKDRLDEELKIRTETKTKQGAKKRDLSRVETPLRLSNLPHLLLLELMHTARFALPWVNLISLNVRSISNTKALESLLLESFESSEVARGGFSSGPEVENEGEEVGVEDESDDP